MAVEPEQRPPPDLSLASRPHARSAYASRRAHPHPSARTRIRARSESDLIQKLHQPPRQQGRLIVMQHVPAILEHQRLDPHDLSETFIEV